MGASSMLMSAVVRELKTASNGLRVRWDESEGERLSVNRSEMREIRICSTKSCGEDQRSSTGAGHTLLA